MRYLEEVIPLVCAVGEVQTLPKPVARVEGASWGNVAAVSGAALTFTALTPASTLQLGSGVSPSSTQIEFNGTPTSPSASLTLPSTATAGELLLVRTVPFVAGAHG